MSRWVWRLVLGLVAGSFGCGAPETEFEVGYTGPVIPLRIGIDSNGVVSITATQALVTPIGVFDISARWGISTSGHRLRIEDVPHDKVSTYELKGDLQCVRVARDDGIEVEVRDHETLIRLHQPKAYQVTMEFRNRSDNSAPRDYPEPTYRERRKIAFDYYFYDYRPYGWTAAVFDADFTPFEWRINRGRYQILDWVGFAFRSVCNILLVALKIFLVAVIAVAETMLLPLGLVFFTGWRGVTVIVGLVLGLFVNLVPLIAILEG